MSCSIFWGFPTFGNGTRYLFPFGNYSAGASSAVESYTQWPVAKNCRIQNMRVLARLQPGGFTPTLILRQNGVNTPLQVVMGPSAVLSGEDLTHSVLLSPGDLISMALVGLSPMQEFVVSADFRPAS